MRNAMFFLGAVAFLAVAWWGGDRVVRWGGDLVPVAGAESPGARRVEVARAFLFTLGAAERAKVSFGFEDEERVRWHFFPRPRKGLAMRDMDAGQRKALQDLLGAFLAERGRALANGVRALEGILGELEGPGGRFRRDPEAYHVSFFGTPAAAGRWGWRLEGHHLSLNFTLDGERLLSCTPLFLGANPALVPRGPHKGLRLLAGVEDQARRLARSLPPADLARARGEKPEEIRGMEAVRYPGSLPEGIAGSRLGGEQKKMLGELIEEYAKPLEAASREAFRAGVLRAGLDAVRFAWRGSVEPFEGHSYLIYGPTFIVGYSNFQGGAKHIHTVLRTRPADFGLD